MHWPSAAWARPSWAAGLVARLARVRGTMQRLPVAVERLVVMAPVVPQKAHAVDGLELPVAVADPACEVRACSYRPPMRCVSHDLRAVPDAIGYATRCGSGWRAPPVNFPV
ncbi:hypothetical protein [Nonomuraea diastatica]|uniref:Uncharacterized protein n=1 Tax=Nonomuraea diastatica TaxID=1848329 RepID=A0A4R4WDW7_9ACTN|nr:hypothetical protein [Nonomuraea diastatica]TDD13595.1 hypothetical protein E1294_40440 [Nonomuraea diastatica]